MNPFERMATQIAAERGLRAKDVLSRSHERPNAWARQEAMWRLNLRGNSLPAIGRWAGRDHTTILFGVRRHHERQRAEHAQRWAR